MINKLSVLLTIIIFWVICITLFFVPWDKLLAILSTAPWLWICFYIPKLLWAANISYVYYRHNTRYYADHVKAYYKKNSSLDEGGIMVLFISLVLTGTGFLPIFLYDGTLQEISRAVPNMILSGILNWLALIFSLGFNCWQSDIDKAIASLYPCLTGNYKYHYKSPCKSWRTSCK